MYLRVRQVPSIDKVLLAEVAAIVAPAMAALALNAPRPGALYLFIALALALLHRLLRREPFAYLALLVSTIPAMMLLRNAFLYNSVVVILAGGVIVFIWTERGGLAALKSDPLLTMLLGTTGVYWLISFAVTGTYESNFRTLELSMSAAVVYLLGRRRRSLGTAFLGLFITTTLVSLSLLPFGGRLGYVSFEDISFGNPISLGLPAALVLLMAITDGGLWIHSPTSGWRGIVIIVLSAVFLLLSTSRGSWLVVVAAFAVIFVCSPRRRLALLGVAVVLAALVLAVMQSSRGDIVSRYVDKAFSSERSMVQRTSGRSEQWAALPLILRDSPVWGFGPGSGRAVSFRYTGVGRTMHSLYLHVAAETGLFGLCLLGVLLLGTVRRGVTHFRRSGEVMPLIAGVGFLTIGITVSSFDAISGVFLGLAMIGTRQPSRAVAPAAILDSGGRRLFSPRLGAAH